MKQETKLETSARRALRAVLLAACLALLLLALPTPASAAKIFTQSFFPPPPGTGADNPAPAGVAVNDSSTADPADGRIYVSDRNRIVAFDSDLEFEFAFGWDTIVPGGDGNIANDEQQELTVDSAPSGTFTLSFGGNTTAPIPVGAGAEEVEDALNAISSISAGGGSVSVSGTNPYTITFDGGPRADINVSQATVNDDGLHAAIGQELPCAPGSSAANLQYQWLSGGDPATGSGATTSAYTTVAADAGKPLQCKVTAQGTGQLPTIGFDRVARSVTPGPGGALPVPPTNIVQPSLSGEGFVVGGGGGQVLTCNPGTWSGLTEELEYQWYRSAIPLVGNGADTANYTIQAADLATPAGFQCVVTGTNDAGSVVQASTPRSIPGAGVPQGTPRPTPSIGGFASTISTTVEGASYEICTEEADCKGGVNIGNGGAMNAGGSNAPGNLAIDQSDGSLYLYENNRRIQKFSPDGDFIWAAGRNVDADGGPDPHLCLAGELCRAGATDFGPEPGLGSLSNSARGGIDVNPLDGRVYVANTAANRAQAFEPDGEFAFMWGLDVGGGGQVETCASGCKAGTNTATLGGIGGNLRDIVIGDGGEVYLANSSAGGVPDRVQRVEDPEADPTDASLFFTAPGALAIDRGFTDSPSDDVIYAARNGAAGAEIAEVPAATGVVTEVHGEFESLQTTGNAGSLAHDPDHGLAGDRLLFTRAVVHGGIDTNRVDIFEDATLPDPPDPTIKPVTAFDARTATLEGTVDPNNNPTAYRFEYVDDATYQADGESFANALRVPIEADAPIGSGDTEVEVSQQIFNLAPGTLYHVRLRARVTGGGNSGTVVATEPVEFTTDTASPEASTAPVSAKATSALLAATVDPGGEETTYRFQYGTQGPCSENPCQSTPPQSAGSAGGSKLLTHQLTGLQANTTYHYRLLASSDLGEAETPDRSLVTIPQNRLPENRAWEKVTPDEKGNSEFGTSRRQASASGDALAYNTEFGTVFPGGHANPGVNTPHLSTRNSDGTWQTKGLAPALSPQSLGGDANETLGYTPDLSKQLVWLANASGVPGDGTGPYLRDNATGAFTEVQGAGVKNSYLWDPGMEHIFFAQSSLRRWSEGEATEQISALPGGGPVVPVSGMGESMVREGRVSAEGSRVFWGTTGTESSERGLYATTEGEGTVKVSASERAIPDPSPPSAVPTFQFATPDGEVAFFTSGEKLTDDSTATTTSGGVPISELYRYDFSAAEDERLTDLTPAPEAPNGAEVRFVVAAGEQGDRLYFLADARLAPGAIQGQPNLYLWEENDGNPLITHVATVDPSSQVSAGGLVVANDVSLLGARTNRFFHRAPIATPDGRRLVFRAAAKLTAAPTGGHAQVYLYDAPSDSLECLSCPPSGEAPTDLGRLGIDLSGLFGGQGLKAHQLRNISADGKRVFFQTATPLLDADSNGKGDVYEWRDGQIHLVSSGQFHQDANFVDASEDGSSVFFQTRERLVPTDTDSVMDAYVARVDGIGPEAIVPPPACEGESCSPLPVAPNDPTPASSTFNGPGNLKEEGAAARKPRCGKNKKQVKQRGKVRCVKKKAKRNKRQAAKRKAAAKRRAKTNRRAGR